MHISVREQTKDGKPAVMCVEREIRVCIILNADVDKVQTLATLAEAIGVSDVMLLAKTKDVEALLADGWMPAETPVLLVKKVGKR
jgi:hypothetical protein